MSDDIPQTTNTTAPVAPKTVTDLKLEELMGKIDAMKESYEAKISELEEANKGLWAAAHPAPAPVTESQPAPSAGFDFEKAEDAFYKALGKE